MDKPQVMEFRDHKWLKNRKRAEHKINIGQKMKSVNDSYAETWKVMKSQKVANQSMIHY